MSKPDIKALSDKALLEFIGHFIRHHRINQNKSQSDLAKESGIDRSTISEVERGYKSNTLTIIQILRALNKLNVFEAFNVEQELSPLQLAKIKIKPKERVRSKKTQGEDRNKDLQEW